MVNPAPSRAQGLGRAKEVAGKRLSSKYGRKAKIGNEKRSNNTQRLMVYNRMVCMVLDVFS